MNDVIETSPALPGGKSLDAEELPGAGPGGQNIFRERVQITGSTLEQVAAVSDQTPASDEFGLVVRPVEGTSRYSIVNQDLLEQILVVLKRIETHMAAITDEELTATRLDADGEG